MKGNGITTVKFKTISIALVMSIILQIVIPILMPLKSIAGTKIEESVTTEKLGDIKLSTTPDNSTISIGDEIIIDVIVTGTDIVGFAGYINYDNNVFNEIDTSNIITSYRIDDDAGPEDDGYYLSVRDGSNIGASNSTMFSIKFVAKANADISTVSIIGIWLTQAGKPAVPDYGPDDMGYDVSITFPEQVETYSVKYNKNTTDEVTEMPTNATNITKGTSYTIGQEPKREGYAFTGWQTADGTAYIAGNSYEINSNLDLYAQWRELNKYTITYNKNTTDEVTNMPTSSETKTEGIDYTIAAAPTRTGHTFEGWNTKSDGTGTSYVAESLYRTDENLELFAKWTPIRTTLTVNPNGGVWETFSTAQDYVGEYNTTKQISNPTSGPKGYLINFDPNGGETEDLIKEQTTTFDRWTLTGGGTLNGNTFTYGTESGTLTATYVGNNIILPLATKQGHRFKGWYTAPTEGTLIGQVGDTYMPDGSKRLYAQWEEIEYNVTINPAGGTYKGTTEVSTETGNFEETIVLEIPKAPKGYTITLNNDDTITTVEQKNTFNKWIKSGKGIIEENIYTFGDGDGTLTATYTPKEVELETPIKNGYRFDGWYTLKIGGTKVESGFIPEEDMILYAHWTAEKYTVTFNPGENATVNPTSKEVTYGEEYGELPVPTKTGGTFLGWYNGNEEITADNIVEITSNITLTAKWEETTYTLTVNLNGGKVGENTTIAPITGKYNETVTLPTVTAPEGYTITLNNNYGSNETKTQKQTQRLEKWTTQDGGEITGLTYTFGEKDDTITAVYKREAVTLEEPGTRTGYTFEGWYTEAENGVKVNNEYEPTGDIELFAHWTAKKYTVTFNPGENATVNPTSKEVTYGEEYGELPVPTKAGGKFLGWYNGETQITQNTIVEITSNITLIARWEGEVYTLTVNLNGGKVGENTTIAPITGTYNETITLPTVTAPEGYTITLNNNYGENQTKTQKQTQRLEKWTTQDGGEITGLTYTFGEKDDTITAVYVREPVTLETITRTGYKFEGWYTEAENGVKVNNEYEPTGDIELFAHWTAEKYTVTFNPGENATVNTTSKEVTYGEEYGELPVPTKTGGTFLGWFDGDKEITADDIVEITSNTTLTAKWEDATYTLTVNLNGGKVGENTTIAPITGKYNETVTLPTVTAPEGYTITLNNNYGENQTKTQKQTQRLEKWTTQDGGEITGSTYTFGEKDDTITAVYKREAVTLEEPGTRTGYTFEGWYTEAENGVKVNNEYEPTGDIELFAHWTAEKYTITFNPGNNATVDTTSKEVTYEEKYGELPIPQRPGYEFNGWYNGNEEITADDIVEITNDTTLTAKWLGAEYTVTFDYGDGEGTQTTKTVRNEGTYGQLPEATKEGHEFEGWFDDNGNKIESTTIVNLTQDITLHARYTPKQYTIKFLNDDGSIIEQKTVNHGDTITYTGETPEKGNVPLGYNAVFSGWDNESKLQNIKEDVTLTATYTLTPITYTITYQNTKNADNSQNPVSYTIEDNNIVLNNLENQGKYIFKGWYTTNDDNGIKVTSIDTSKLENIILYAQWENDGLYLKSKKYKIGENNIDIYEQNDVYLDKIEPKTTVTEFINNCETNGNITVINQKGQELQADDLVGTNMTVKVTRYDEEINITSVVMGDLDGNGLVTPTDLSDVNKIVLKILKVEGAKFKAADIDDSQRITPSDLSDINKTILGLIKLTYTKK